MARINVTLVKDYVRSKIPYFCDFVNSHSSTLLSIGSCSPEKTNAIEIRSYQKMASIQLL